MKDSDLTPPDERALEDQLAIALDRLEAVVQQCESLLNDPHPPTEVRHVLSDLDATLGHGERQAERSGPAFFSESRHRRSRSS